MKSPSLKGGSWSSATNSSPPNPALEEKEAQKLLDQENPFRTAVDKDYNPLTPEQRKILVAMVASIVKAKHVSGGNELSDNHVYWHTREAVIEHAMANRIYIAYVIILLRSFESRFMTDVIERLAEPVWPQVGHPDVIVAEVMES